MSEREFGCDLCWPDDPTEAWAARSHLIIQDELEDNTHFTVSIRRCDACFQRFVSVLSEQIDWTNGEDPQHWILMPLTPLESVDLDRRDGLEERLGAIGIARRCLVRDVPSSGAAAIDWSTGMHIPPHD